MKAKNKEDLEHDDDQEMKETKKGIKYSSSILEEAERKDNEYFLSHVEDLEQQEDLMTESSNETIKFCGFETNKLCVMTGVS